MDDLTVLITGAGAPGIKGTLYSLHHNFDKRKIKTIGTDIDPNAVGRYLCDSFHQISRATSEDYIDKVLTRITLPGALFFALIAVLPNLLMKYAGVTFYFGGTGILIVVGVALDTLQQMESHLIMRHYDGFMKKGRIRGRSM